MAKIKFLTDTASDIPLAQAEAADIEMLSFMLTVNGDSYREQRDLSKEEFYDLLEHSDDLPSTSQITAFTFEELFRKYLDEGVHRCDLCEHQRLRFGDLSKRL